MLAPKRYDYYLVKFDDEKTYWYRSGSVGYQVGKKVIAPVSNNGKWKIGLITERHKFKMDEEEKRRKERELLESIEFEEEMEDLDQYN